MQDDLFCKIAVEGGLLTPDQVAIALDVQRGLTKPQRIGKILIAQGFLTPIQVDQVLHRQSVTRGKPPTPESRHGGRFGEIVIQQKLATEGEVVECVLQQRDLALKGDYVKLGELLVKKNYLSGFDVTKVLEIQARLDQPLASEAGNGSSGDRSAAFAALVRLKRDVAAGRLQDCLRSLEELKKDHEYARIAEKLVRKAFLQHAASRATRERGLSVKTCDACETASAIGPGGGACARCGALLEA